MSDTIFAESTAPLRAAVAIFRISGPAAGQVLETLTCRPLPTPRQAVVRRLWAGPQALIDQAMVIWLPGPGSFTGEDMVELHCHGGVAVRAAVQAALSDVKDVRAAAAGEFTRRAFMQGRLDLTQVEAIADLVDAETTAQRRQALRQMDGALGQLYEGWRSRLITALAHLEAVIDFSDEELPADLAATVAADCADIAAAMGAHLADNRAGERLREGVRVAVVGPPNAGKSSLVNLLARRDVAIVSAIAGTTRDVLEAHLDIDGLAVVVADTAGLRESQDEIEAEGIKRARRWAAGADLRGLVVDRNGLTDTAAVSDADEADMVIVNKADLGPRTGPCPAAALDLSTVDGTGVEMFMTQLSALIRKGFDAGGSVGATRARHRQGITDSRAALSDFAAVFGDEMSLDLAAEDLRVAVRALGQLTGRVDVEDLLDVVFSDFCIGK